SSICVERDTDVVTAHAQSRCCEAGMTSAIERNIGRNGRDAIKEIDGAKRGARPGSYRRSESSGLQETRWILTAADVATSGRRAFQSERQCPSARKTATVGIKLRQNVQTPCAIGIDATKSARESGRTVGRWKLIGQGWRAWERRGRMIEAINYFVARRPVGSRTQRAWV